MALNNLIGSCPLCVCTHTPNPVEFFIVFVMIYVFSSLVHEIGHVVAYHNNNIKTTFSIGFNDKLKHGFGMWSGTNEQYISLDTNGKRQVIIAGVLTGLLPIVVASFFNEAFLLLLAPYIIGCLKDFEMLWKTFKKV